MLDDIWISRWTCDEADLGCAEATTPPDRYFFAIALKTTCLKLTRDNRIIFDGNMPAGTIYVGGPSKRLRAQFQAPCDFLHFHVKAECFLPAQHIGDDSKPESLNDLVQLRDPLAGQLTDALTRYSNSNDHEFARCIARTLAMHIARRAPRPTKIKALPKWRLSFVEQYIADHFNRNILLSELASVAGLSRMHFAAQFRAATGYQPHDYLLRRRIKEAQSRLSNSQEPLADIALAVGFCTQAHFSTVFKRITGISPARWRCANRKTGDFSRTKDRRSGELRNSFGQASPCR